ncbi:MAG: hypothetical protein M3O98_10455 [Actinomycetota bacterium]|nr:hypothetical protein [Actinomycetota bacterium]
MGAETGIYIRKYDGNEGPSSLMKDMIAERDRRGATRDATRDANPEPPIELPRDKVRRLASEFHARAHARELAPKLVDASTGKSFVYMFGKLPARADESDVE